MKYKKKGNLEITRQTKGDIPSLPFFKAKEAILGRNYELSLSFIGHEAMRKLSKEHKGSFKHMNTLAFPMEKGQGEIVMNLKTIRLEARSYYKTYLEHLLFLFIHSCLHLKGYKHGKEMEKMEDKYFNKFN